MDKAVWYVLRTKARHEEQVGALLQHRDVEFFLPMLKRDTPTRTGRLIEPFFPCYLFVRFGMPSEEYVRARSAPGVIGLVSFDGLPASVPGVVVQSIKDRLELESRVRRPSPFQPGQRVIITEGPFKDVEAIFDKRLTGVGRARVLVDLLGKSWRVDVKIACLSEAGQRPKTLAS